jgi:hypothetical protein
MTHFTDRSNCALLYSTLSLPQPLAHLAVAVINCTLLNLPLHKRVMWMRFCACYPFWTGESFE